MRRLLGSFVVVAIACGSTAHESHDGASTSADGDVADVAVEGTADGAAAPATATWIQLVREQRWAAAAAAIDGLPDAERKKPEVRFARASVAMARHDGATAITALDALEPQLPALASEIARLRARAQSLAGPFADAGEWLEKHATNNDDLVAAATAFMKAKLPTRATSVCAHIVASEHKSHAQEVEARAIRMHTGEAADAIGDARWLLVHGDASHAKDAEAIITKDDPKHPLTQKEWLSRAQALADAAQVDDALHALDRASIAPQPGANLTALRRARADVMMRARVRYMEAAALFKLCSNDPTNKDAASDLVWSARALSRADHDDEAIERYDDVIARHPKSPDAAAAAFYAARLEMLHGRWDKAAARFDDYATKHPNGADRDEAMHLRAIAHLEKSVGASAAASDVKRARTLLEQRAGSEHDPVARARMENLAALAAAKDGDKTHAIARFTDVAKNFPLTWAALVARARLVELGAPVPPAIASGATPDALSTPLTVTLPDAVATLDRVGLDGAAEEALRAREGEITSAAPARSVEALCVAYGKIDRGKRRMQLAAQISSAHLQNAPTPSTRWAWECAFPTPFNTSVRDAEIKETLPAGLIHAVMRQESSFDEGALSPARAIGLLQLLPETGATVARNMGVHLEEGDLKSGARSVDLGAHYLHDLLIRSHGSVAIAVASYNAGEDSVLRWAERMKGMELDAFVEAIPFAETRGYVVKVMENFARYGYLDRGELGVPKIELK